MVVGVECWDKTMTGYTFKVKGRHGTASVDVCDSCHEKLDLPTDTDKPNVRIVRHGHEANLYRDDHCIGCGESVTSGFGNLARPFDGDDPISPNFHKRLGINRDVDGFLTVVNMADALDVFATDIGPTEEVTVAAADDGTPYATLSRPIDDAPTAIHFMVMNDDGDSRDEMEERCRQLCRLLLLNGFDGAPRPNPTGDDDPSPDWEIYVVPLDD